MLYFKKLLKQLTSIKLISFLVISFIATGILKNVLNEFITPWKFSNNPEYLFMILIQYSFLIFIGFKLLKNSNWAKYAFLFFTITEVIIRPYQIPNDFYLNFWVGVVSSIQILLQFLILFNLFNSNIYNIYNNIKSKKTKVYIN